MSIEKFVEKLRACSEFGLKMTMQTKFMKHLKTKDVRKLRTYLVCLKLAYPQRRVRTTVDEDLMNRVRDAVSPYYEPNPHWKEGMDKWLIFKKIKEPPEM